MDSDAEYPSEAEDPGHDGCRPDSRLEFFLTGPLDSESASESMSEASPTAMIAGCSGLSAGSDKHDSQLGDN